MSMNSEDMFDGILEKLAVITSEGGQRKHKITTLEGKLIKADWHIAELEKANSILDKTIVNLTKDAGFRLAQMRTMEDNHEAVLAAIRKENKNLQESVDILSKSVSDRIKVDIESVKGK